MNILTKSQLRQATLDSLFKPVHGHSLAGMKPSRFDLGKYKPGTMAGKPVPEHARKWLYAVWVERRRDSEGPYDALFCYSTYNNGSFHNIAESAIA